MIRLQAQSSPRWRRVAAFGVDYGLIVAYLGLIILVGTLGRAVGAAPRDIATPMGRVVAQLVVFAVLTVPVTVWFAWWEAAPRSATPGKRLLGLQVVSLTGAGLSWRRSLGRSALKITLPWELAHTGIWNILVWPADPNAVIDVTLLTLANAVLITNAVLLLVGSGRTLYDRATGTVVHRGPQRDRERGHGPSQGAGARSVRLRSPREAGSGG